MSVRKEDRLNPLAFLGLKRVGVEEEEETEEDPSLSKQGGITLNRRGIPARKRKKNSLIYGTDDLVSIPIRSPRKRGPKNPKNEESKIVESVSGRKKKPTSTSSSPAPTPTKPEKKNGLFSPSPIKKLKFEDELTTPEKETAHRLGVALRNLLKLPKAHKWVCFEFFYSNIDKVLFHGENDFMVCLRESFPRLKTRRLTRVEWCKIRRMMGKPRRCSSAFFCEERAELARKRHKIRMLQQRKQTDITNIKDLPEDIPLQLTIGTRVTARLRTPQDGLFTGAVDAFDTSNNTYRITFDRLGLDTHSIPDYEVLSNEDPEMMSLSSFAAKVRTRPQSSQSPYPSPLKYGLNYSPTLGKDPLLSGSTPRGKVMRGHGHLGCYPVRFLERIVRLSKCLKIKREKVDNLRKLNSQGEKLKTYGEFVHEDFQRRYASNVIDLSNLNRDLNEHLKSIQEYAQQFGSAAAGPIISLPNMVREGCKEEAYDTVTKNNSSGDHAYVESPRILALVSSLTALMIQIKQLADGERNSFELQALHETINEIKGTIDSSNTSKYEDNVEVHIQHIQSGLSRLGNLHAFMLPQKVAKED
ncbi:protein lin-9 homolog [Lepeophtheirus salmonis]|uniref:protein lin-9 homolog n=1 Tax=Lepeophtheirus salmonis TaxID=72036 RepID=UPI001AE671A6|nr:protein lin-9 homolog [Lepeophtheirus salmonis]